LKSGDAVNVTIKIPQDDYYLLYTSHWLRAAPKPERIAEVLQTTGEVKIDGSLDEWGMAQPLHVDTKEQILRGASAWPGPEEASFIIYYMWDDTYLYVAARVQDPEHIQNETGPSAWSGDTLWLYFDTRGDQKRVDVKLTFAETPQGSQVWNWTAQSFLPGAQLAWSSMDDGYIYEAALPLESMNFLQPEANKRIHFDAGKGFTGGFIDWTGLDPDTAENLAPLNFVSELSPAALTGEVSEQSPFDVAFTVEMENQGKITIPQAVSPDRDYLWLDLLFPDALWLEKGEHDLMVTYAGEKNDRESIVDAFMILPATACKHFENDAGNTFMLCHDMYTANTILEE
jgi:hypothetical protein